MIYTRHLINGIVVNFTKENSSKSIPDDPTNRHYITMMAEVDAGDSTIVDQDDTPPPPTVRERRAKRYRTELSNGNASDVEALADTLSAALTEIEDVRNTAITLTDEIRLHGVPVNPLLFGDMTPNLAERLEKIAIIQAEEV